ncbi:MAG: hypothetical protein MUO85_04905, partial [candidate division Zixibacteria bacterium]|nr:hypothetical protein [candidate division Zixibacteria bacterium]
LESWLEKYEGLATRHRDADGVHPKHTFFYPSEQFNPEEVKEITQLCQEGFGEMELHLHHFNDSSFSLTQKLLSAIKDFTGFGWMISRDDNTSPHFAFVHGNWALDNSIQGRCGVNNELKILKDLGCFADFTFPAIETDAQPKKINSIYYAVDDTLRPKSYDWGRNLEVGAKPKGDLLIFEGPLGIDWKDWRFKTHPLIENGDLYSEIPPSPYRVDKWIRINIHIKNQPNWIFVKVHCHAAHRADTTALLGKPMEETFSYLEKKYNDGTKYILHYVSAREAYNIAKAAEDGKTGNPNLYRDYIIRPYKALRRY